MTEPLNIGIIVGSVRERRISLPIANWVKQQIDPRPEFDADLLDLLDWQLPMFAEPNPPATGKYTGEKQRAWAATIGPMDGFILVAPEYNHGMSAVLKNALDTVAAEWARKPVAFVAHGGFGGARSVEQLREVTAALAMAPLSGAVHLQGAHKLREGDRFKAGDDENRRLAKLFDELDWWGRALRAARNA
ncbi:NAD(P)H-dependent oxidoreductase [Sphingomonas panacisoli]|uniref:NAD(P)H-dependent oxidoreductase n=1 Tax=Sphingomonas panacisoli TaxID=1813879 RepID=A0A5B8LJF2_9SPHN|nr:NADPH-dependent FMN reductase [Sphingomonas panacisoli]QDZ08231.1 NAD(P)H-dependent oxidoreductase [Sphingomonas panacisoli]